MADAASAAANSYGKACAGVAEVYWYSLLVDAHSVDGKLDGEGQNRKVRGRGSGTTAFRSVMSSIALLAEKTARRGLW